MSRNVADVGVGPLSPYKVMNIEDALAVIKFLIKAVYFMNKSLL